MHTNLGKEGFLLSHIPMPQAIIEASEDRNLKKQPEQQAEAIKEYCLLACSSWLTEPVFFLYHSRLLAVGWTLPHQPLIKTCIYRLAYRIV